jgi:hypothetical protein
VRICVYAIIPYIYIYIHTYRHIHIVWIHTYIHTHIHRCKCFSLADRFPKMVYILKHAHTHIQCTCRLSKRFSGNIETDEEFVLTHTFVNARRADMVSKSLRAQTRSRMLCMLIQMSYVMYAHKNVICYVCS